ncbi:hypothetical protein BSNK01_23930 [Bacillaceae bacterium]
MPVLVVPLGLSGAMFSTMAFFTKYQWWFVALSISVLVFAHYISWKRKHFLSRMHFLTLWLATGITFGSVIFVLYTYGYFS